MYLALGPSFFSSSICSFMLLTASFVSFMLLSLYFSSFLSAKIFSYKNPFIVCYITVAFPHFSGPCYRSLLHTSISCPYPYIVVYHTVVHHNVKQECLTRMSNQRQWLKSKFPFARNSFGAMYVLKCVLSPVCQITMATVNN